MTKLLNSEVNYLKFDFPGRILNKFRIIESQMRCKIHPRGNIDKVTKTYVTLNAQNDPRVWNLIQP